MDKTIKTAIIGFGLAGRVFHAPIINCMKEFQLCKIYTKNEEAIKTAKGLYNETEFVKDMDSIFEDKEIDLIIIATPNIMHYELAKRALLSGKHVLVEKPFTVNSEEAEELIELSEKQRRIISVYQNRRWDSDFLTIKKILDNNMLGNLVEYEAHFDRFRNTIKENAWREENTPGSGILYDLGSHLIDQALCLFGLPKEIYADIRMQRACAKTDDSFEILMYYDKLKVTLKSGMLVKEELPRYILLGDKGSFVKYGMDIQEDSLKEGLTPANNTAWGKEPERLWGMINTEINGINIRGKVESEAGDYRKLYKNIYACIVNGDKLEVTPRQAANTIKLIELAMESNRKRAAVKL